MRHILTALTATAAAAALTVGSVVALPDTTDPVAAPATVTTSLNPLAPQQADAAWWHNIGVIQWRSICGYGRTTYLGNGYYSHEVKRWATTVYSQSTCILSGERMTNRVARPYWGMTGWLYGSIALT